MNRSRVTYCTAEKAAGEGLDDIIAFLRAGCGLSTARLFAQAVANPDTVSCETWKMLYKYVDKLIFSGAYEFQTEIIEKLVGLSDKYT